mmetsp:Transcript_110559/g.311821  ORF Transcript_110559/g.311821 Transcript_110559/m.311821 type:complete len:210 (-) Transcript_110559:2162-2791(-)
MARTLGSVAGGAFRSVRGGVARAASASSAMSATDDEGAGVSGGAGATAVSGGAGGVAAIAGGCCSGIPVSGGNGSDGAGAGFTDENKKLLGNAAQMTKRSSSARVPATQSAMKLVFPRKPGCRSLRGCSKSVAQKIWSSPILCKTWCCPGHSQHARERLARLYQSCQSVCNFVPISRVIASICRNLWNEQTCVSVRTRFLLKYASKSRK